MLLIGFMKAPRGQKRLRFDDSENEESQGFINHESDGYIPLPLILPQKELNRPLNLDEGTKSLTHLVSI